MCDRAEEILKPYAIPRASRFEPGPYVHVQFDGGSAQGVGTGGFVILDPSGEEIIRCGLYFGGGWTSNEAEATALSEAILCLEQLARKQPRLKGAVRIWGDSLLTIRHLIGVYKKPSKARVYDAITRAKDFRRRWKMVAFRHLPRNLNLVADDMARRSLVQESRLVYWGGRDLPSDSPPNQATEIYSRLKNGQWIVDPPTLTRDA